MIDAGKEHWVQLREDKIVAKGKGELTTYWLTLGSNGSESLSRSEKEEIHPEANNVMQRIGARAVLPKKLSDGHNRIVEWNVDLLQRQLKLLVAHRRAKGIRSDSDKDIKAFETELCNPDGNPLQEVKDVITLPKFNAKGATPEHRTFEIDETVMCQLRNYVKTIAGMYQNHPFHNYEHARYVYFSRRQVVQDIAFR